MHIDDLWSPDRWSAVYFPDKLEGFFCCCLFWFWSWGSHVAQALKLAFVADAGLELLLTLLVPLLKF